MASTLLGLVAALVSSAALNGALLSPSTVEAVVARIVNDEAQTMAAERGFRPGPPWTARVLDRAHLAAERDALSQSRRPTDLARAEASLWRRMGIGGEPRSFDAASAVDPTGFYDPVAKRLIVGNWVALDAGRFARWKDIAEAVLDRRYPIARFVRAAPRSPTPGEDAESDVLVARQALLEGDATVQALERLSPEGALSPRLLGPVVDEVRRTITDEAADVAPLALARRLLAQLDGPLFVAAVRARAPWTAVNEIWARPPTSSEQILHPEKYWRREPPADVAARIPRDLPGGWQAAYRDTLGEIGTRVFLERTVGSLRAERAATGWGGDCATLFRSPDAKADNPDREFVVWMTTWDGLTDADDFAEQASYALGRLAGAPLAALPTSRVARVVQRAPRRWRQTDTDGRVYALEQRGPMVGMLIGAPPELERTLSTLMASATDSTGRHARPTGDRVRRN